MSKKRQRASVDGCENLLREGLSLPKEIFMSTPKKCAHEACSCIAADGKKYCSETCEAAKDVTELACQCNHPGCSGEALKA